MKTLIDMHTHTGFSPDGEGTVEQLSLIHI